VLDCICSDEWLLSYDVRSMYVDGKVLPHSEECEDSFSKEVAESRNMALLRRWKWITATENCDYPYNHKAHGACSGRAFDRT